MKELALVQVIVWYIKVELLRTKQVPTYLPYSQMDKVPSLKLDIEKQALCVYSTMYRHNGDIRRFFFAHTNDNHLDGKVGVIAYYDASTSCYQAKLCQSGESPRNSVKTIPVLTENMEPHRKIRTSTYVPLHAKSRVRIQLRILFHHLAMQCLLFYSVQMFFTALEV